MARETDKQRAQLEKLNDAQESRVVMNTSVAKDISHVVAKFNAREDKKAEETAAQEAKLRSVKVNKEDIDALVNDFSVKKEVADRLLRVHNGDLLSAANFLVHGGSSSSSSAGAVANISSGTAVGAGAGTA